MMGVLWMGLGIGRGRICMIVVIVGGVVERVSSVGF